MSDHVYIFISFLILVWIGIDRVKSVINQVLYWYVHKDDPAPEFIGEPGPSYVMPQPHPLKGLRITLTQHEYEKLTGEIVKVKIYVDYKELEVDITVDPPTPHI